MVVLEATEKKIYNLNRITKTSLPGVKEKEIESVRYLFATEEKGKREEAAAAESVFCTAEAPHSMADDLKRANDTLEKTIRSALPRALLIIKTVSMAVALILVTGTIRSLAKVTLMQAYHNAPTFFWIGGAAAVIWLGCAIYERAQVKRLTGDGQLGSELESKVASVKSYLDVPEDTDWIDVLSFRFQQDESGMRFRGKAANSPVELYRQGDTLCLFDGLRIYSLPLEGASLHVLKLGVPVDGATWNKDEGPDAKKYRKYGVTLCQTVQLGLSFCCALDIVQGDESYRLLFPAYELDTMQRLTGLPTPKLPKSGKGNSYTEPEHAGDFSWSSGPVRPRYYWRLPKGEVKEYLSFSSDVEFKAAHPVAYGVLITIGLVVLLLPCIVFAVAAGRAAGNPNNGWILLGVVGGFVAGVGLFNLVAAWLHQYLGHVFTLVCLLVGGGLMAFTWFVLL